MESDAFEQRMLGEIFEAIEQDRPPDLKKMFGRENVMEEEFPLRDLLSTREIRRLADELRGWLNSMKDTDLEHDEEQTARAIKALKQYLDPNDPEPDEIPEIPPHGWLVLTLKNLDGLQWGVQNPLPEALDKLSQSLGRDVRGDMVTVPIIKLRMSADDDRNAYMREVNRLVEAGKYLKSLADEHGLAELSRVFDALAGRANDAAGIRFPEELLGIS